MNRWIATSMALIVFATSTAGLCAEQGQTDVLDIAPADAWAVVCVRNMGELDSKLNALIQQASLPAPPNPVAMALSYFGFLSGLNPAGGVGVVMLPAPSFPAMRDRAVLVIPTQDFAELVSLIEPEEVEPGISKAALQGHETYITRKGDYALFGPSVDAVKQVHTAQGSVRSKLNAHLLNHYQKDDLVVWVNAEAVTASDSFKAVAPMLQAMNFDPAMLTQLRSLMVSLRLGPAGIGFGLYTDGVPGSDAHKVMVSQKASAESLLLGLPKDRYVLGYGALSGEQASRMGADLLAKVLDMPQLQALPLEPGTLQQFKDLLVAMIKPMRTLSFSVSGLPEGPDGLMSLSKVVGVEGDPKEALSLFAQLVALLKSASASHAHAAAVTNALEYKPAAETVGEWSVDHLTLDLTKLASPDDAESAQEWSATAARIFGKDGILFRMGVVDSRHVVMTFGGGAERFNTVAGLVKAGHTPLAEEGGIRRSAEHLPARRSSEGYFAVDQLLNLVGSIAKAVDEPIPPLSLGELNAPIAFATEPVEAGGSQAELFVPMELVIAVKDLAMSMMGGQGTPGGPGASGPQTREPAPPPGE